MPSTYAHRRFGADVLTQLPAEAQALVQRHRELYDIGLHGPDLFFYYHALKPNPVSRMGNAMHAQPGEVFFARVRPQIPAQAQPEAAMAYVLGFICHFVLDSTCHPYIEQYVRTSGVSHCEIETEFDNVLLRQDGHDPLRYFTASHIRAAHANAAVIAPLFGEVTERQTYGALRGMLLVHRGLQARGPLKRWLILTVMRLAGQYDFMHGLVANPEPNPQCAASSAHLQQLYAQAVPLAVQRITEYLAGAPLDESYRHTFNEF